jgi:hypothetical protein
VSAVPTNLADVEKRLGELAADLELGARYESQLAEYGEKLAAELGVQLTDLDLTVHRMEGCGYAFFDETLTIGHILDLFDQNGIAEEYDGFVLADTASELDCRVEDFTDWLLSSEMEYWQKLRAQVEDDGSKLAGTITERLDKQFDYDRSRLFAIFGRVTRDAVEIFDPGSESAQVGEAARNAATNAVFLSAAAVAAIVMAVSSNGVALGLSSPMGIAAGLAAAAACVIPYSRRRAKKMLHRRAGAFREHLLRDFRRQAEKEIALSKNKIAGIIETPLEEVRQEHAALSKRRAELNDLEGSAAMPPDSVADAVEPERF